MRWYRGKTLKCAPRVNRPHGLEAVRRGWRNQRAVARSRGDARRKPGEACASPELSVASFCRHAVAGVDQAASRAAPSPAATTPSTRRTRPWTVWSDARSSSGPIA